MWKYYALLSAFFASLTAIFAKIGVKDVNSDLATAIQFLSRRPRPWEWRRRGRLLRGGGDKRPCHESARIVGAKKMKATVLKKGMRKPSGPLVKTARKIYKGKSSPRLSPSISSLVHLSIGHTTPNAGSNAATKPTYKRHFSRLCLIETSFFRHKVSS